jgi:TatD DNase family protein
MWIDTHCHPFADAFDADREAMIQRARDAGVEKMIVVGFDPKTNRQALEHAAEYDFMWATLGVHPCDVAELTEEEFAFMERTARENPRVVAIGETGLDYYHMNFPKDQQEEAFRRQIRLAKSLNKPVIVHSRDAAEDTLRILVDEGAEKVVFHCYTYDYEFGKRVWERGYYTSFSGILTYPSARDIQEAARKAPADLILIETDCPYLAPQSIRGKRNEIASVVEVGEKLAELRGIAKEKAIQQMRKNVQKLFF